MPLVAGARLGPYEILAKIGAGGMGEVYRARDTRLDRDVAIKILPASLAFDERAGRRLLREARAAGALDHPNICTVYEAGEEGDQYFIVMQYVDGETLAGRSRLSLDAVLTIAEQIAGALAEAHRQGIVHRDVKPQNIMVTSDGRVKILDFGLAQIHTPLDAGVSTRSIAGPLAGTIRYMSPEQIRGEELDARSD